MDNSQAASRRPKTKVKGQTHLHLPGRLLPVESTRYLQPIPVEPHGRSNPVLVEPRRQIPLLVRLWRLCPRLFAGILSRTTKTPSLAAIAIFGRHLVRPLCHARPFPPRTLYAGHDTTSRA